MKNRYYFICSLLFSVTSFADVYPFFTCCSIFESNHYGVYAQTSSVSAVQIVYETPTNNCGYLPYQGVPIASSVVYGINGKEADACWKEWSEKYAKEKGLTVEVLPIDKYLSLGFNMMINEGNYGSVILVRSSEQNKRLYLNAINGREINTESYEELAANLKISKTIAGPGKNIYIITRPDLEDEVPPYKE